MATTVATPTSNGTNRRKSGRVVQAPPVFSQEQHHGSIIDSAKRKRPRDVANDDDGNEVEDDDEMQSEDSGEDEGEPDEEELREKKRKQRARQAVAKPAAKRARTKTNNNTTLAIRSAARPANKTVKKASKAAKDKARSRQSQAQSSGLYADVFGKGNDAEAAATTWHSRLEGDHVAGITDMVNFVLQVVGCDARVTMDDINDVDNIPNKLSDILEQYSEQEEGDYPLSGKQKSFHGMKEVYSDFFRAIPHALHNSGLMYEEVAIYDNLHVWIATMSAASYRSFRVTATLASLAMSTGLTEIAKEIQQGVSATKQQLDAEKKKKSANKARIAKLQEEMAREEKRLEVIDTQLKDEFDIVYTHRYRDVEEKLRVECARAMGTWIQTYRHLFLESTYLRYLGWVMSDPHAATRLEVIRQLKAIYRNRSNLAQMRGFTDRFRARMVEMGTRDADLTVRVETIELLNMLRSAEMLEPDDIDTIGQLIFDDGALVRRAVAQFVVSNIQDLYNASVEDFDREEYNTILPDVDKIDDFDEPCKLWIKFKALAQILGAQAGGTVNGTKRHVHVAGVENLSSKYMVATQSIFYHMPELQEWESLTGYLLHDHSTATKDSATDLASAVQAAYKLQAGEESILLDVLFVAAKLFILQPDENKPGQKGGRLKKERDESKKRQETAAHNLSAFIPKLYNKFGSIPEAAKSILRLNQLFNPDLVDEFEDDDGEGEINTMVSNISNQFTSHQDEEVLAEAVRTLRAALTHEASREAAMRKVNDLWKEQLSFSLSPLLLDGQGRGSLDRERTRQLSDATSRLAQLASVKDCCETIEGRFPWVNRQSTRKRTDTVMDILLQLVRRGNLDDDTPPETAELEDQVCQSSIKILLFYYRWKAVAMRKAASDNDNGRLTTQTLTQLVKHKNEFTEALVPVVVARKPLDSTRLAALLSALDLYVLLATCRNLKSDKNTLNTDEGVDLQDFAREVNESLMAAIMETHEALEKRLARRTNKKNIELPLAKARKSKHQSKENPITSPGTDDPNNNDEEEAVDRPPEDSDDEDATTNNRNKSTANDSSSSDDDDDDNVDNVDTTLSQKEAKRKAILVAETSLCELTAKIVLALLARVIPNPKAIRARLQVNRTKLGKSYTQVIAYADDKKDKNRRKSKAGSATPGPKTPVRGTAAGKGRKAVPTTTGGGSSRKVGKAVPISEAMVLSDDDIEDDEEEEQRRREDDDPEVLREQGLEDDPIEQVDEEGDGQEGSNEDGNGDEDEDEIMGD
ncbi:cohesin complex subunit [Lithohypha guttulata]|uniref:Cohesin complex subunit n=1 Tax=Lithohypha guttulata TaxID=1690604 RepID=A0AAN7YH90_9EURO|nr:cohesin complex subunit [Lithohypha guttulata]